MADPVDLMAGYLLNGCLDIVRIVIGPVDTADNDLESFGTAVGNSCRIDLVVDERIGGAAGPPVRPLLQQRRERGFGNDWWITSK